MVGGIGVMAIMTISVTERTREIGLRKALGARRKDVLLQFLAEAVALTSLGGVLGIVLGSTLGISISLATGFPVSLPWWSFAIGLGFSAAVGIFFGMVPAVRAADSIRSRRCATSSGHSGRSRSGPERPERPNVRTVPKRTTPLSLPVRMR
jgi:ABC-type antimicrobial peptide transport system permease subunit